MLLWGYSRSELEALRTHSENAVLTSPQQESLDYLESEQSKSEVIEYEDTEAAGYKRTRLAVLESYQLFHPRLGPPPKAFTKRIDDLRTERDQH